MCDFDYLCFTKIGCGSAVFRSKASFWLATALAFRYLCSLNLKEQHEKAKKLLEENREVLDKLAMYLCEKETITGEEFMEILNKEGGMQK